MSRKYFGMNGRAWIAVVALLAVVVVVAAMTGDRMLLLAQGPSAAAKGGMSYAKSLSQAFREVAEQDFAGGGDDQDVAGGQGAGRRRKTIRRKARTASIRSAICRRSSATSSRIFRRCPGTAFRCRFARAALAPA